MTAIAAAVVSLLLAGCDAYGTAAGQSEAQRGATLIAQKGCGYCHIIPGIADADGLVGPPLDHMANRIYVAGILRNSTDNLSRWIRNPQQISPGNAMPDMNLSRYEAHAMAVYLGTLE